MNINFKKIFIVFVLFSVSSTLPMKQTEKKAASGQAAKKAPALSRAALLATIQGVRKNLQASSSHSAEINASSKELAPLHSAPKKAIQEEESQGCFGYDRDCQEKHGWAALHFAALKGHVAIVETLLAAGADKDRQTLEGLTPLHIAAINGHVEVVRVLLRAGADINRKSKYM